MCYWHDPAVAERRRAACAKGGEKRTRAQVKPSFGEKMPDRRLRGPDDILALIEAEIGMVRALDPSIARARAVGYLAGQWTKVHEQSEIVDRIVELERRLDGRGA